MTNGQRPSIKEQLRSTRQEAGELGSIGSEIVSGLRQLSGMEAELARAEMNESMRAAQMGAMFGGTAAALALVSTIFVCLTLMYALDTLMPIWLAALITTVMLLVLTGAIGMAAMSQFRRFSPLPKRFIRSVQEDVAWAKAQLRSSVR